jgi:hypothetical protein
MSTTQSDDVWRFMSGGAYVPYNASVVYCSIVTREDDLGSGTVYFAEPMLTIGGQPPRGIMPAYNEFFDHRIFLQGMGVSRDAYIPTNASSKLYGKYAALGDVCWNDGSVTAISTTDRWRCTTAGVNGSGAIWTAYAP